MHNSQLQPIYYYYYLDEWILCRMGTESLDSNAIMIHHLH